MATFHEERRKNGRGEVACGSMWGDVVCVGGKGRSQKGQLWDNRKVEEGVPEGLREG